MVHEAQQVLAMTRLTGNTQAMFGMGYLSKVWSNSFFKEFIFVLSTDALN